MIYHSHKDDENGAGYSTLDDLDLTVKDAIRTLRTNGGDFDGIIVTGISGLVVGAPVALALGKPLFIVRKSTEDSHDYNYIVNGKRLVRRLLFLDDLIASGDTFWNVQECLRHHNETMHSQWQAHGEHWGDPQPVPPTIVASYLYERDSYEPDTKSEDA